MLAKATMNVLLAPATTVAPPAPTLNKAVSAVWMAAASEAAVSMAEPPPELGKLALPLVKVNVLAVGTEVMMATPL